MIEQNYTEDINFYKNNNENYTKNINYNNTFQLEISQQNKIIPTNFDQNCLNVLPEKSN